MKLLIVEDDDVVAALVREVLSREEISLARARNCAEGRALVGSGDFDALILDVMLPDGTGIELLTTLRGDGLELPCLMLTSLDTTDDVVRGLDAGADDYLTKPFAVGVLAARVRALLRRAAAKKKERLRFGSVEVDRLTRAVTVDGKRLRLTPKEYAFLEYLMLNAGRVVSRTELLQKVWNLNFDPGSNVVDAHLARLRSKLHRSGSGDLIATIRGGGFLIAAPVQESSTTRGRG
jgi:two-component system, OmpR family, response regulator